MRKIGIGLATGGLILSLFFVFGGRLPALERNVKTTKIALDRFKEFQKASINSEETTNTNDNYQKSNETNSIKEDNFQHSNHSNVSEPEPNYSRIHKNRFRDHRDYVADENGKIYENKPCYNCSGEGYTIFINPANGQKEPNICNACNGVGQIGYDF